MIRSFNGIILSLLIAIVTILPRVSYAEMGTTIESTNCNPAAVVANDYRQSNTKLKSCKGQGIKLSGTGSQAFKLNIKYEADADFIARYVSACTAPAGLFYLYLGAAAAAAALVKCGVEAAELDGTVDVPIGNIVSVGDSIIFGDGVISFEARIEGDKACIYGKGKFPLLLNWQAARSTSYNTNYGITDKPQCTGGGNSTSALPAHCVYLPLPEPATPPAVPAFIARSCLDYDTSATQFRWPPERVNGINSAIKQVGVAPNLKPVLGESRAFTGIVVQCIEDTMMNLFFNKHKIADAVVADETIFVQTQNHFKSFIHALLVLYVIYLGYKYGILEKGALKQKEFMWIGLKIAVVLYFAAGPGVTKLLPDIINGIKQVAIIIIDAGAGDQSGSDKETKRAELKDKGVLYQTARIDYASKRLDWAQYDPTLTGNSQAVKDAKKTTMDASKTAMDAAGAAFELARIATLSFGYNYCDFRPYVAAERYDVETEIETGADYDASMYKSVREADGKKYGLRDMRSMQLWDTIDCKLAKYLGFGANPDSPTTPQLLLIGFASLIPFGPIGPMGMVVTFLTVIFLMFVIFVVIRVVHIYIISFISLVLLVYISPLVIPMILFNYTKSSFDAWFKQMVAYSVQPIILFAFLAFMFAIFDSIVFGDNYEFKRYNPVESYVAVAPSPATDPYAYNAPDLNDNTIKKVLIGGNWVCPDEDTIGCMYQRFAVSTFDISIFGAKIISFYNLSSRNISASAALNFPSVVTTKTPGDAPGCPDEEKITNVTSWESDASSSDTTNTGALVYSQWISLIVSLMKLVFASFILHALLGQVEEISKTITNAAAGGAVGMSAVPRANPGSMVGGSLSAMGSGAASAGSFIAKQTVGRALKKSRRAGIAESMAEKGGKGDKDGADKADGKGFKASDKPAKPDSKTD